MMLEEVMARLEAMGSEQTKSTLMKHGAREPFFGVKIGDLKKLVKDVKKDQGLVYDLYDTGNSDAMYLAGLSADPKRMTAERLRDWARKAYWYLPAEYTVSGVAAESPYALELAREWVESPEEMTAVCGWSTYTHYLSVTPDAQLDLEELQGLLRLVEKTVHGERNRVRYAMNQFVLAAGCFVEPLHAAAKETAAAIGAVQVNVGRTACKVPLASEYIAKVASMGKVGAKKKTCIC